MEELGKGLGNFLTKHGDATAVAISLVASFIPTVIAGLRKHHQNGPICVLNMAFVLLPVLVVVKTPAAALMFIPFAVVVWLLLFAWSVSWVRRGTHA